MLLECIQLIIDDFVANIVGQQVQAMYNTKLAQIQHAYPDIESAAKTLKIGQKNTIGVSVRTAARRAPARRTTAPKRKTTKRKTRKRENICIIYI